MKLFPLALLFCAALFATDQAQLKQVQSVYILPMGSGMDQYLANKISRQGLFHVVTDPQKADALFTDQIGEGFERKFVELYPPVVAPKDEDDDKDADADSAKKDSKESKADMTGGAMNRTSSWGRGKGTFFLVDRKSRAVIWSTYDRAPNRSADTLDHKADQIVGRLKRDLKETK